MRYIKLIISLMFMFWFPFSANSAGVIAGTDSNANAIELGKSVENIYIHGAKGDYLAGFHSRNDLDCVSCHGDNLTVDDSETLINKNCESCHGSYQELGQEVSNNHDVISAHAGHLVNPSCTACHSGHQQSFTYCNNCHIFDMNIPYGRKDKIPYIPEDLSKYDNARPNRVEETDIVIVGAGGAGIVAAMEASKAGKNVILLEKMPIIGGSSLLSTGGINAANTSIQRANGIQDSVDMFVKDTLTIGKGTNDEKMVRLLAEGSADAVEWFLSIGGELTINPKEIYGGTQVARMHYTKSGGIGKYMTAILAKQLAASTADVRLNSKAVRLNKDQNGRITGVLVQGKNTGIYEIRAKATVLTTGSYGNNQDLVVKYHPEFKGIVSSTQPGAHGDGLILAEKIGAEEIGIEKVQIHPNIAKGTSLMITLAMRLSGGILVNEEGQRFMNDNAPRNEIGAGILAQPNQHAYLIYDENVANQRKSVHEGYQRLNFVVEANSPAELADKLGIPKETLVKTMQTYAKAYEMQNDAEFGRKELAEPLTHGKLYAIDVVPAVGGTLGGLAINTDMQVLDVNNQPIPGLFAAGEVVGGWHGDDRYGGNAVAGNIVFGKRVAQSAVKGME